MEGAVGFEGCAGAFDGDVRGYECHDVCGGEDFFFGFLGDGHVVG